ncbi:hypothetical protein [Halalkalibacter okhensis]|uniref:Integral inner membrane protein n=1 Tax=Halalkalibacter okhensis TaxID=333138 RepID=A0A0B0INM5_9BACI|nr:hypothetical protein [Halalkalibacter okhensis]KHF41684.1 hypothetical protein LQ50_03005 [Halalkalibacter okhensis]
MSQYKEDFLLQLEKELERHPRRDEIILEFDDYIEQKLTELLLTGVNETNAYQMIMKEIGQPEQLALQFNEKNLVPSMVQKYSILVNYSLFMLGILITILYYFFGSSFMELLWNSLVSQKWMILSLYMFLWSYLGFLIGKNYGYTGEPFIRNILKLLLVPNFLFMILVLYMEPLQKWFSPFITPTFITVCIIVTFLFYPISKASFKLGIIKGM